MCGENILLTISSWGPYLFLQNEPMNHNFFYWIRQKKKASAEIKGQEYGQRQPAGKKKKQPSSLPKLHGLGSVFSFLIQDGW